MRVLRSDLQRFRDGHRAAEAQLREATLRGLRSLTVEAARVEYDSLCRVWAASPARGDVDAVDRFAIEERVAFRRRFAAPR